MKLHIATLLGLFLLLVPSYSQDSKLVRMPPSITASPPRKIGYKMGDKIELKCEATGDPEPEFRWFHNGALMDKNRPGIVWNKGTMIIEETTSIYQGEYQCFASNQHGTSMSAFTNMTMNALGSYPEQQIVDYNVRTGDKLRVTCNTLKSIPKATFSWASIKDESDTSSGQPIQITERIQMDDDGNLYFSNVMPSDHLAGALYKCTVYNPALLTAKGGSLSRITVQPGTPDYRSPTLEYSTQSPIIGLRTRSIMFKCLYSGNESPKVSWMKVGGSLPFGRHTVTNAGTTLTITEIEDQDEGEYECVGKNSKGTERERIQLMVHSEPVFVNTKDRPMNDNFTEGSTAEFKCHADAIPEAAVTWYINGQEIREGQAGPRRSIVEGGLKLRIENLCKDCTGEGEHVSDLMNIQCLARNKHNYTFADAYLNVLKRTVITEKPEDYELVPGEDVVFKCAATSDDATPVTITWLYNDKEVYPEEGRKEILDDNSLRLITENDDDKGASFEGLYTCMATNGYSSEKQSAKLTLPGETAPVAGASVADWWWVFLIIALILLLLILIFCCCICMQRNKGDSYPVDEKERAQGNDPLKELDEDGYHDYQRPEDAPIKGSRASLTSTIKLDSDDEGSLNEYGGDLDTGKFNEDGSFIGQYIEKDKKRPKDSEV